MKKILVADDTKNIRFMLTTCLKAEGYDVLTASNGEEALNLFEKENFDLAFLDIKIPEISGTEVLRRIRSSGIQIPVIIMTGFATVKNAVECTKLGAVAYLQKPFTTEKVRATLDELLKNDESEMSDNIEGLINSCKRFLSEGEVDEAYNLLKKALSIDPTAGEVYHLIGVVYERKANIKESEIFYNISKQFK